MTKKDFVAMIDDLSKKKLKLGTVRCVLNALRQNESTRGSIADTGLKRAKEMSDESFGQDNAGEKYYAQLNKAERNALQQSKYKYIAPVE